MIWAIHRTALGRELFHQCCKKQNHHWLEALLKVTSTAAQAAKKSSTQRHWRWRWVPVKVAWENNSVSLKFSLVATNIFCNQTLFKAEGKFVIIKFVSCLLCLFFSNFFNIKALCHFKVLLNDFMWTPFSPYFFGMVPPQKPFFLVRSPPPPIPPAPPTS